MTSDTAPIGFTAEQLEQIREHLTTPRRRPWRAVLAAACAALILGCGAGYAIAHATTQPRVHVITRTRTRTVTKTVTVTRWRTRTTTVDAPGLVACAESLMGAWETDGQYADDNQLPPSAAQGYNPDISACEAYPAVWNTPPDMTP